MLEPHLLAVERPAADVEATLLARRWPAVLTGVGAWTQVVLPAADAEPTQDPHLALTTGDVPLEEVVTALAAGTEAVVCVDEDAYALVDGEVVPLDAEALFTGGLPALRGAVDALLEEPFRAAAALAVGEGDRAQAMEVVASGLRRPVVAAVVDGWTLAAVLPGAPSRAGHEADDHSDVGRLRAALHETDRRRRSACLRLDELHLEVHVGRRDAVAARLWGLRTRPVLLDLAPEPARSGLEGRLDPGTDAVAEVWGEVDAPGLRAAWDHDGLPPAQRLADVVDRLGLPPAVVDVLTAPGGAAEALRALPGARVVAPTPMTRAVLRTASGGGSAPSAYTWVCALLTPLVTTLLVLRLGDLLGGRMLHEGALACCTPSSCSARAWACPCAGTPSSAWSGTCALARADLPASQHAGP